MREILFRGKRIDNGEWIEGHYIFVQDAVSKEFYHCIVKSGGEMCISELWDYEFIDKDTLSEFTGCYDKNGEKIFEGDIVEFRTSLKKYYAKVYYKKGMWSLYIKGFNDRYMLSVAVENDYSVKVIDNIHDNPELLEVTE